jgi:hypothetical protein
VDGGDGLALTPALAVLPNSGMVVRFPLTMGLNPDFTANEETQTLPDVFVEQSVEDMVEFLQKYGAGQATGRSAGGSGLFRPDPDCDTVLRKCLELALGAG